VLYQHFKNKNIIMAKLTKTDIEKGEMKRLLKINLSEDLIIYKVVYNIDGFNYRLKISEKINSSDELISIIYNSLLNIDKYDSSNDIIVTQPSIEVIDSLIGQPINEPRKDEGDGKDEGGGKIR
jgi:hypothetical protein